MTLRIVDLWQHYGCYIRSVVTRCTLSWCSTWAACASAGNTRCFGRTSVIGSFIHLLAAELLSTAELLFPCQYLCGTIFITPYSMVWAWRVSRARPLTFYWPSYKLPVCHLLFSLSLLSFYMLVLWGVSLRIPDRMLIDLSEPASPTFFDNKN